MRQIEEAARYFPRERLGLSTQCGFGTVWEGNPITEEIERDKLRLVADLAHRLWH
jgi:5-methyltetrahydropteroyltriglutamate--homocysteine methyltransferase